MPPTKPKPKEKDSLRSYREARKTRPGTYTRVGPNSKPQWDMLASTADIVVYGGSAGGGKTFGLLMEPTRHLENPRFGAVFFRRTMPEITMKGGAWDKSEELYYGLRGIPNLSERKWYFPSGSTFKFAACPHDKDIQNYRDSQIPLLIIDQAETFTEKMWWGLWSRCRTDIGIKPYARLGCNPEPDSWLLKLIGWWIGEDGYAIPERSGVVRWFIRHGENLYFADDPETLVLRFSRPGRPAKPISITFILAVLDDNVDMERADPDYRARMELLPFDERMRLLGEGKKGGNWKVRAGQGMFPAGAWKLIDRYDAKAAYVRYWDTAATEYDDPNLASMNASTVGVLVAMDAEGPVVIDVAEAWAAEANRDAFILNTAKTDRSTYGEVEHWFEQEPGGSGKQDAKHNLRVLEGFSGFAEPATGDKVIRARPWASAVQAGRVRILNKPGNEWVKGFIDQHRVFPFAKRKDMVDAAAAAYNKVVDKKPNSETGIAHHNVTNFIDQFPTGTF